MQKELQRFTRLQQSGNRREAERALDSALELVAAEPADDRKAALPSSIERRLRELRQEVERLSREGRQKDAERTLERTLRKLRDEKRGEREL